MKRLPLLLAAFAALLTLFAASTPAEAHGRIRGGVFLNFGVPWPGYYWGPRYYYGPPAYTYYDDYYYGPPTAVVIERRQPEYVERSDVEGRSAAPSSTAPSTSDQATANAPAPSQVKATNWWYWCESSKKYYPYVKECSGGFERVPPQPVPPANR
jgi:hypothetical protein